MIWTMMRKVNLETLLSWNTMLSQCLKQQGIKKKWVIWILYSGCSRHMARDRALLSNIMDKTSLIVLFGDNIKGFSDGYGCLEVKNVVINNIFVLNGLNIIFSVSINSMIKVMMFNSEKRFV